MAKPKPRRECRCRICQGKLVASSTWYDHNPGAKKKSRPPLPQEVMDAILKRPETNTLPRTWKRHLDEDEEDSPHISKRAAGSSSGVGTRTENAHKRRADSEMSQSRTVTPLESESETDPPPPAISSPLVDDFDQEPLSPFLASNQLDDLPALLSDEEDPPAPFSDSVMAGLDDTDTQVDDFDDVDLRAGGVDEEDGPNPPPGPDEEDPPPPESDEEDPPPPESDEEDSPSSDSDKENPPSDDEDYEDDPRVAREDLKRNLRFISMLENATLAAQFNPDELEALRHPQENTFSPSDDPDLLLSIAEFIAHANSSQKTYAASVLNHRRRTPEVNFM